MYIPVKYQFRDIFFVAAQLLPWLCPDCACEVPKSQLSVPGEQVEDEARPRQGRKAKKTGEKMGNSHVRIC